MIVVAFGVAEAAVAFVKVKSEYKESDSNVAKIKANDSLKNFIVPLC